MSNKYIINVQALTFLINQSNPSFNPIIKFIILKLPSPSFALLDIMVHALSFIISKLKSSSISSAGRAEIKSYLFANINNGKPVNLSSYFQLLD